MAICYPTADIWNTGLEGVIRAPSALQSGSSVILPLCSSGNSKYVVAFLFGEPEASKLVSARHGGDSSSLVLFSFQIPTLATPLSFSWEDAGALRSLRS